MATTNVPIHTIIMSIKIKRPSFDFVSSRHDMNPIKVSIPRNSMSTTF